MVLVVAAGHGRVAQAIAGALAPLPGGKWLGLVRPGPAAGFPADFAVQQAALSSPGERLRLLDGATDLVIVPVLDQRMRCKADEVNFLSGPGRGVILIKIDFPDDKVIGAIVSRGDRDLLTVDTSRGAEQTISTTKYEVTGRGGKGRELLQRGQFTRVVPNEVPLPVIEVAAS